MGVKRCGSSEPADTHREGSGTPLGLRENTRPDMRFNNAHLLSFLIKVSAQLGRCAAWGHCCRLHRLLQPGSSFHLPDDGIKGAVRVLRRTEIAQARVWFGSEAFQQLGREPRFADPSLTAD